MKKFLILVSLLGLGACNTAGAYTQPKPDYRVGYQGPKAKRTPPLTLNPEVAPTDPDSFVRGQLTRDPVKDSYGSTHTN